MVFSHNSPYVDKLREPSRLFSFFDRAIETEVNLTIIQQWAEGGHGGTDIGFGASVYDCSFLLSYYVNQHPELVKGKKVVELGCGPGLASLVAGLSGASKVIATDGDPISVALTQKNIETNQLGCDISAMKLYWSNKEDMEDLKSRIGDIDVVIASDVAALPYASAYTSLINTMYDLTTATPTATGVPRQPTGIIYLCSKLRHVSETDDFLPLFNTFFHVTKLPAHVWLHPDFMNDIGIEGIGGIGGPAQFDMFKAVPRVMEMETS